jgi:hypothetical protein
VGQIFYGSGSGVAPGISHVDNYEAGNFYNNLIGTLFPPAISAKVVNQSFIFGSPTQPLTVAQQQTIDQAYDNYVARYGTIFVSGAGNSGTVTAPATAYNGIGVGAYGGSSATGPTLDGGRSKPDITAPASVTSFSTPLVSGAAALLVQAGTRGDGGAGTSAAAVDPRTIKALLLNGASKPADWAHTPTQPLDPRYGAGVLNIYNSWQQLKAGQQPVSGNTTPALSSPPTPISSGSSNAPAGWDFNSLTSSATNDSVNHYLVTLDPGTTYKLTGTVTWERQENQTAINNLDLLLYNVLTGTAIDQSISSVDNVEHLYTLNLTPGIYDLEVLKHGGATEVTDAETYALAYSFSAVPEPGAFSLLAICAVGLLVRPWRGSLQ